MEFASLDFAPEKVDGIAAGLAIGAKPAHARQSDHDRASLLLTTNMLHVALHEQWTDELRPAWEELAGGVPFRSFTWLKTWWRHYAGHQQLCLLIVRDDQARLVGVAPWCAEVSASEGRVLRPLGTGEVCSDYLSVLAPADAERQQAVAAALAEYLCGPDAPEWDGIHLEGVDYEDPIVPRLADELLARQCGLDRQEAFRCWRAALPNSWEAFVALQSKSHRKQLRRFETRVLATDRAKLHLADEANFERAWEVLIDLHQRRRKSLDQPGCFASPRFAAFHRDVAEQLLAQNRLRLWWLELDGVPIASEYHFAGDGINYAYQSGVDPDRLDEEPGRLITIATIQQAIEAGQQAIDFLRGDEPYKAHWRAEPRPAYAYRLVANSARARLRHSVWKATGQAKSWLKTAASLVKHAE